MISKIHIWTVFSLIITLQFETIPFFGITAFWSKLSLLLIFFFSILRLRQITLWKELSNTHIISIIFICWLLYTNSRFAENAPFVLPLNILIDIVLLMTLIAYRNFNLKMWRDLWNIFMVSIMVLSVIFIFGIGVEERSQGRYSIFDMNENMLGFVTSIAINLALIKFLQTRLSIVSKFVIALTSCTMLYLLLATGSRGAAIVCFVASGVIIYKHTVDSKNLLPLLVFLIATISVISLLLVTKSNIIYRLQSTFEAGDVSARDYIWLQLLPLLDDNLWTGIGVSRYAYLVGDLSPHNVLLEILLYGGLFGLLVFLAFLYNVIEGALRSLKVYGDSTGISLILNTFVLILGGQIFDQRIVWIIFAFCLYNRMNYVEARKEN